MVHSESLYLLLSALITNAMHFSISRKVHHENKEAKIMKICGLQKTTLLDFPGHVAATIFLGGCNFRCPFCHNSGLLGNDAEEAMSEASLFTFLKRRTSVLEGVCITGDPYAA